jgi:hypothetical protein
MNIQYTNKMIEDIKSICVNVLSKQGISEQDVNDIAEGITVQMIADGYIKSDSIELDPEKSVVLVASLLNKFKEDKPFVVIER